MNEYEMIMSMAKHFPSSPDQLNEIFTCDAELITIGADTWGMSMDEFTPEEDMFFGGSPHILGHNLAVCTLSDLYAAGVTPRFYMHSIALPHKGEDQFRDQLLQGVAAILKKAGCFLLGGDLGTAALWRYCGYALGRVEHKAITRLLPVNRQGLWVTGSLGDANVAAIQESAPPLFELRNREAGFIREHATGCIDTSGGFMDALNILVSLNPQLHFSLHPQAIPYAPEVDSFTREAGIPKEAALMGGAGEYELLFTLPADSQPQGIKATRVGDVTPGVSGAYWPCSPNKTMRLSPPPCPRATENRQEYIKQVLEAAIILNG